jgi:hypothetical protein
MSNRMTDEELSEIIRKTKAADQELYDYLESAQGTLFMIEDKYRLLTGRDPQKIYTRARRARLAIDELMVLMKYTDRRTPQP